MGPDLLLGRTQASKRNDLSVCEKGGLPAEFGLVDVDPAGPREKVSTKRWTQTAAATFLQSSLRATHPLPESLQICFLYKAT